MSQNLNNWEIKVFTWCVVLLGIMWGFMKIEIWLFTDYCECQKVSQNLLYRVRGEEINEFDLDRSEQCAINIVSDLDINMDPKKMNLDFIQQVSYEMCENGYYVTKGKNGGKKIYN